MGKEGRVLQFIPYFESDGSSAEHAISPSPLPIYLIGKDHDGALQVSEFVFRHYRASAAIKNPFFKPDAGFHCVVPTRRDTTPIHPLMQAYGQFILTKQRGDNMHYALCTFYADTEVIAYHKKTCFEKLAGYFCKQQAAPNEHVKHLMSSLRGFEANSQGLFDAQFAGHDANDVSSGFAYTNVFVDPSVTLHDLQQLVNAGIQQKGNMFYLENDAYFMLFLN
jgi:hypothetical protein